jgi:hypothetical protein
LTTIPLPGQAPASRVDGPTLSLDRAWAYVNWTERFTGVGGPETLQTLAVPLHEQAFPTEPQNFRITPHFPPNLTPAEGYFAYEHLSNTGVGAVNAAVRQPPVTLAFPGDEMVMVVPVQHTTRTRQQFQPTLIYWREGVFRGYQVLTWTHDPSIMPSIAADANHNLYVAWIDSVDTFHYPVYLMTTAPDLQAAWQDLTWDDAWAILTDLSSRIASGIVLLPLIAMWLLLPFLWLFVMLARGGDNYGARGVRILLVALVVYEASKYLLTRRILTYVPMLAYLPPATGELLIYGIPLLTLLISFGIVAFVTLRRIGKDFSVMRTYLYTTLLDVSLSVAVYGIGYWE